MGDKINDIFPDLCGYLEFKIKLLKQIFKQNKRICWSRNISNL